MSESRYIAGECNIGREEINRRRNVGWLGAALTFMLIAVFIIGGAGRWWRLLTFFPASFSASGFIQARLHFCAGFARMGIYNFGPIGENHDVLDEASRSKDRKRGYRIAMYSALIGAIIAIITAIA